MTAAVRTVLVTGGAGFIGSALVRHILRETPHRVINVDKLTYAGNLDSLDEVLPSERYAFEHHDIGDAEALKVVFERHRPDSVIHLAAESHVDRSIEEAGAFMETNLVGTFSLLQVARGWRATLGPGEAEAFRFLHVSTDEVYGSLGEEGLFTEETPYDPRSPYSASKAGSDHLARAWFHTYGLPVIVTNCSNNYGPYQFPEKLIPVVILSAITGKSIPVYGQGLNVRDWLFVEDHVRALLLAAEAGVPGRTYNIGGRSERRNIDVVRTICSILDELRPRPDGAPYADQIQFVEDRPGHDWRYAIDCSRIEDELGWSRRETFESGMRTTVEWYLTNSEWCERAMSGNYRLERLGLTARGASDA